MKTHTQNTESRITRNARLTTLVCISSGILALFAGCATYDKSTITQNHPDAGPTDTWGRAWFRPEPQKDKANILVTGHTNVTVFYATDRKPDLSLGLWKQELKRTKDSTLVYYGSSYSPKLQFGSCEVTIPMTHMTGAVERPTLYKLELSEDPKKHFTIQDLQPLSTNTFLQQFNSAIEHANDNAVLVFIHGFNVKFADAVMRTAQLTHDLRFNGASILYSWPSKGDPYPNNYMHDEDSIQVTVKHLKEFLSDVILRSKARRISLIAHSMGNRALTDVLMQFAIAGKSRQFDDVVLVAPDINEVVFREQIAPAITSTAKRITLYGSADDRALKIRTEFVGEFPRLGKFSPNIPVLPGIETVDASGIDTDLFSFRHSYFAECWRVVSDLQGLVCFKRAAQDRKLDQIRDPRGVYWKIPQSN